MLFHRIFNRKSKSRENSSTSTIIPNRTSLTLKKRELEKQGIVVSKTNCTLSGAAIKLLLDNIATPDEIQNILKTNEDLKNNYLSQITECEFCKKKCDKCRVCCLKKEMQMLLVSNALRKLSYISLESDNFLLNKRAATTPPRLSKTSEGIQKFPDVFSENSSDFQLRKHNMKTVKRRLSNMRKYFPDIFYYEGNIIEQWGNERFFQNLKQDLIDLDDKKSNSFWI